jgi:eukaryotic-like serine/threonine-protein kinase
MNQLNCINKNCSSRYNHRDSPKCSCGTLILLKSRYRVLERIGRSSNVYEVFRAEDTRKNNKIVAIKTLTDSSNKNYKKLFYKETAILEYHKHSCLPALFDQGDEDSVSSRPKILYFVMEFIAGQTLSQWLTTQENKKLSQEEQAWEWLKNITKTLTELHDIKHWHLDLKPDNIMLREDDSPQKLVLIDFSIDGSRGTAVYKAPERKNGINDTPMVDVFSLGQTFVYLTTGDEPETVKPGDNWASRTNFPSSPMIEVINWMKEEDPVNRPQTTYQILYAIDVLSKPKSDGIPHTQKDADNLINNIRGRAVEEVRPRSQEKKVRQLEKTIKRICTLALLGLFISITIIGLISKFYWDSQILIREKSQEITNLKRSDNDKSQQIASLQNNNGLVGKLVTFGETDLNYFPPHPSSAKATEAEAIKFFKLGEKDPQNYKSAFDAFKRILKSADYNARSYSEIAIYMNNAKIRYLKSLPKNKGKKVYKIAVVSPVQKETGQHILLGVGFQQQLLVNDSNDSPRNNDINSEPKIYLEIGIADDENNEDKAKKIADELTKTKDILAVIGHYTTETMQAALDTYTKYAEPIAVVSPTASAFELTKKYEENNYSKNVFFRTVSSTQIEAKAWFDYLDKKSKKREKAWWDFLDKKLDNIRIIYNADRPEDITKGKRGFSQSLFEQFNELAKEKINFDDSHVFSDLSNPDKTGLDKFIDGIHDNEIVLLIPKGNNDRDSVFSNALHVLDKIQSKKNITVIGSNPLFSLADVTRPRLDLWKNNLLVAVDWQSRCPMRNTQDFETNLANFTGGDLDRRTASAYEAAQVLSHLFKKYEAAQVLSHLFEKDNRLQTTVTLPRSSVIQQLKNISSENVDSGIFTNKKISFLKNGDRKEIENRIMVTPISGLPYEHSDGKTYGDISFTAKDNGTCHKSQ